MGTFFNPKAVALLLVLLATNIFAQPYGSNLWLAITGVTTNAAALDLHNTEPDVQYEIQSLTNLARTNWASEVFVFGSGTTNLTATNVLKSGRTNLFLRIRSWLDTYDMGIPDWWQLQYFGYVGIDPYASPAGDGYSNLYKFQRGLNPFTSYAPQAPTFGVTPAVNDSGEVINWNPALGAVTGYTIYRNGSAIATVSASTFSYTDSTAFNVGDPNDSDFPVYTVQANYSGASYASPQQPPFNPKWAISPAIIRGAQGQYILLVPNIPSGVTTIRFYPQPAGATYPDDFFNAQTYLQTENYFMPFSTTNIIDVPVTSFTTNGEYVIPPSSLPSLEPMAVTSVAAPLAQMAWSARPAPSIWRATNFWPNQRLSRRFHSLTGQSN